MERLKWVRWGQGTLSLTGRPLEAFPSLLGTAIGWRSESFGGLPESLENLLVLVNLKNSQRGEPPRRGRGAAGPRGAGGPQAPPLGELVCPLWGPFFFRQPQLSFPPKRLFNYQ